MLCERSLQVFFVTFHDYTVSVFVSLFESVAYERENMLFP